MSETKRLTDFFVPPTLKEWLTPWSPADPTLNELSLHMKQSSLFLKLLIEAPAPALTPDHERKIEQSYNQLLPGGRTNLLCYATSHGVVFHYSIDITFWGLVLAPDALLGAKECQYYNRGSLCFTTTRDFDRGQVPRGPEVMDWLGFRNLNPARYLPVTEAEFLMPDPENSNLVCKDNIPLIDYCTSCTTRYMVTGGELVIKESASYSIHCLECIQESLENAILHCVKDFPDVLIRLCQDHV